MIRRNWQNGIPLHCAADGAIPAGQRVALSLPQPWQSPVGSVLLRARLHWQGRRGQTLLFWLGVDGIEHCIRLPVTRKGTLLEVVDFGAGAKRLWLQPMTGEGSCVIESLSLRPQQGLELHVRRLLRVLPMFHKVPRHLRKVIGLHYPLLWQNLPHAYYLAGEIRDDVPDMDYRRWRLRHAGITDKNRETMRQIVWCWQDKPGFSVLIQAGMGDRQITLDSLDCQLYREFELCNAPASDDPQGWCVFVPAGVALAEHALFCFAQVIREHPAVRVIYADHDLLDVAGEPMQACFKPDWSPAMALCSSYAGPVLAVRNDALGMDLDPYAALLRLLPPQPANAVHHVPWVLSHVPASLNWRELIAERNALTQVSGTVVEPGLAGYWRVRHRLPAVLPTISVIVPTRDALPLLRACVESVLGLSTYPAIELLVVDNNSRDPAALDYLCELADRPNVRVLRYEAPFNYSAINNFAVREARGEVICLLNNDTEVISADWLEEMLSQLVQPRVGAVGAKLYFSDGSIQHAGDAVGPGGCADHFFSGLAGDDPGYMDRAMLVQDLSAVTAACLLTWRQLYQELGGLDEHHLPVAFNDVDFCLRVRESGLRVVWTPYAELYHHESVSRGKDQSPEDKARADRELAYMRKRWKQRLLHDPFYNPNLSYDRPDFSLNKMPRVAKPWDSK